jgi:hypothetical protein
MVDLGNGVVHGQYDRCHFILARSIYIALGQLGEVFFKNIGNSADIVQIQTTVFNIDTTPRG